MHRHPEANVFKDLRKQVQQNLKPKKPNLLSSATSDKTWFPIRKGVSEKAQIVFPGKKIADLLT